MSTHPARKHVGPADQARWPGDFLPCLSSSISPGCCEPPQANVVTVTGIVSVPSAPIGEPVLGVLPSLCHGMRDGWLRWAGTSVSASPPIFLGYRGNGGPRPPQPRALLHWYLADGQTQLPQARGQARWNRARKPGQTRARMSAHSTSPCSVRFLGGWQPPAPKWPLLLLSFFPESCNWLRSGLSGRQSPRGGLLTWREGRASSGFFSEHSCSLL